MAKVLLLITPLALLMGTNGNADEATFGFYYGPPISIPGTDIVIAVEKRGRDTITFLKGNEEQATIPGKVIADDESVQLVIPVPSKTIAKLEAEITEQHIADLAVRVQDLKKNTAPTSTLHLRGRELRSEASERPRRVFEDLLPKPNPVEPRPSGPPKLPERRASIDVAGNRIELKPGNDQRPTRIGINNRFEIGGEFTAKEKRIDLVFWLKQ